MLFSNRSVFVTNLNFECRPQRPVGMQIPAQSAHRAGAVLKFLLPKLDVAEGLVQLGGYYRRAAFVLINLAFLLPYDRLL
jgi:hypothetical protein